MSTASTYSRTTGWRIFGTVLLLASGISIAIQMQKYGYADSAVNQQILLLVIATLMIEDRVGKGRVRNS